MDMNKKDHIMTLPKRDLKTRSYNMDINKKDLKRLSKSQLIKLLLEQEAKKPSNSVNEHEEIIPPLRTGKWESIKPKPVPRKSVNEDVILPTRKPPPPPILQVEEHITNVPPPKIKELNRALKGHAKSYGIELQDNLNPLNHFTKTKALVESHLEDLLKTKKGFKFIETMEVTFEKQTINSKIGERVSSYKTSFFNFFNGKAKTITKANDIEPEVSMSRQEILNTIDKWVSEGSRWVIYRIDGHYINGTTYQPLNGSSYLELPTELRNPKKGLINIKSKDNECFRWCHIRHLTL